MGLKCHSIFRIQTIPASGQMNVHFLGGGGKGEGRLGPNNSCRLASQNVNFLVKARGLEWLVLIIISSSNNNSITHLGSIDLRFFTPSAMSSATSGSSPLTSVASCVRFNPRGTRNGTASFFVWLPFLLVLGCSTSIDETGVALHIDLLYSLNVLTV